ncbi:MAG TPA: tetratricopeptide repeat protein, partial [Candidatus Aminicenantes bacterium]|nr:tetratricopeptide repeat protein [Candidatus Aminicenantes bacterium]
SFTVKLAGLPLRRVLSVPQTIAASDLDPDYYEIRLELVGANGETLGEGKGSFVISPLAAVGHPIANAKGFALANQFLYRYMLAQQAERTGRRDQARSLYDQAYQLNPDYREGVVMYAAFLNKTGAFGEALQVAERLRGDDQRRFPFHVLRGQALMGQGKFQEALDELVQANRIYDSDTTVLNALGQCYLKLGRKTEALEALKASLKLNPAQPAVQALIREAEK